MLPETGVAVAPQPGAKFEVAVVITVVLPTAGDQVSEGGCVLRIPDDGAAVELIDAMRIDTAVE